jgi:hypothetical protein
MTKSIILTIYVTIAHFIKTNVNHPNNICNIRPFYKKLMSIILTIYVTLAHFIKTNVNHPNNICNIRPFYKN